MKAVVVDFDGTLYRGNSFEDCVKMTLKGCLKKWHIASALRISTWVALRKLRLVSHARMKYQLQPVLEKRYDKQAFLLHLRLHINQEIWEECLQYRALNYHLCLATAAPEFYIESLAENMNFDSYCATPRSQVPYNQWKENRGESKKEHCLQLLAQADASLELLITDHADDLPLLKVAKHHIIVKQD